MKRWIWITVLTILSSSAFAGEKKRLFEEGNKLYSAGSYTEAAASYNQILSLGFASGEVYYNLGNCHYKLGETGRAILNYERARKWMPRDPDLAANLMMANLKVVDQVTPLPQWFGARIVHGILNLIPYGTMIWMVLSVYWLAMIALILWLTLKKSSWRPHFLKASVALGAVFIVFTLVWFGQRGERANRVEAVILQEQVAVMSTPGGAGVEVFTLHEGVKILVGRRSADWAEIRLADGKVGWVQSKAFEVI